MPICKCKCTEPDDDTENLKIIEHIPKTKSAKYKPFVVKLNPTTAEVDAKAPIVCAETYAFLGRRREDAREHQHITFCNYRLFRSINYIQRLGGEIKTNQPLVKFIRANFGYLYKLLGLVEHQNKQNYERIISVDSVVLTTRKMREEWEKNLIQIQKFARRPIVLPCLIKKSRLQPDEKHLPRVFIQLYHENGKNLGKMRFVLFKNIAPNTVNNFMQLCENSGSDVDPNFVGLTIYRVYPGFFCESGGMIRRDGCKGMGAFECNFPVENYIVKHDRVGIISMIPTKDEQIDSRFAINFYPHDILNGKHSGFGRLYKGFRLLKFIEEAGTKNGITKIKMTITSTGVSKL